MSNLIHITLIKGKVKQEQTTPTNTSVEQERVSKFVRAKDPVKRQLFTDESESGNWVYSEKEKTYKLLKMSTRPQEILNNEIDDTNRSNIGKPVF